MSWKNFAFLNLICALAAAAIWYVYPQAMAWPLLLGILPWMLRLGHEGKWRWRTPFDLPLLLFVISASVSVWSAYDREMAWAKFWPIAAGLILFYAFAAFCLPGAPGDPLRGGIPIAWFLAFFGAGVSLYFLATHDWDAFPSKYALLTGLGRSLQSSLPQLPGHRLHPNVVGGILAMMIPFSAAISLQAARVRNWPALILGLILAGMTAIGLLLSVSRGAWIAVLAAASLAVLWWAAGWIAGSKRGRRRLIFTAIILFALLSLATISALRPDLPGQILEKLPLLAGGQDRLTLFQNSLILVQEYPFLGAGLSSFPMLYSTYSLLTHVGFIIHAHNIYIDVWIEQGIFGLIALLWMWIVFAIGLWRESESGRIRPYFGAAALSLTTILLHGMVEDALYGSRAVMLLFLPLAFALPYPKRAAESASTKRSLLLQGVILASIIIVFITWARPITSSAYSNLASVRQSKKELSQYSWPDWPIQDALRREIDLTDSIAGFEKALALNPANAAANRRLGQIELSLGEYEDALEHLQNAYSATPWDHATRLLFGEALLVNDRIEEGKQLWAEVNHAQNQLQSRVFWYQHIAEEELLGNIKLGLGE